MVIFDEKPMPPGWQSGRKMKKKSNGKAKTFSQTHPKRIHYRIPKEGVWMTDLKKAADYAGQLLRKPLGKLS